MATLIMAHDLGTSGNKASLFSDAGILMDSVAIPYETQYPKRGWAEQNPEDWWESVCRATRKVLEGHDAADVKAVAVSGHMMGCLPLDQHGEPLSASMIWSDGRAEEESKALIDTLGEKAYNQITGQLASPYYPLPKIMWLRKHRPEIYERAECFLQAKDYINFKLTGALCTDITDAAYTLAYDINRHEWSDAILRAADVSAQLLPTVVPSATVVGTITKEAATACGLKAGTPVAAGAGDGSAAHLGAASVAQGDTYICLGSSSWIMTTTDHLYFDRQGRMQSEPHVIENRYVFGGTMQTGGMSYAWAQDNLGPEPQKLQDMNARAALSAPGAGGILFLPYLMGERSPWYDPRASASFLGLRQESTNGDMLRAVLEGVSHNLKILLDVIQQHTAVKDIVLIGGGAKSDLWRQIMADVLEKPILVPENVDEGTSMGSAIIAGIAAGIWPDYSIARELIHICARVEPEEKNFPVYQRKQAIFEDAFRSLQAINHRLFHTGVNG